MRILVVAAVLVACAPTVDGPRERQRAIDRADGDRLATQLAALPGVMRAEVVLRRAARDPLATTPASAPGGSIVVIVDDGVDPGATARTARTLARAIAPELDPAIVARVGAPRPRLAKVGPFTVEAGSRRPLQAALAITLALIAALAGWIAWRERRRVVGRAR